MYLTYEEYQNMGGTLDSTAFSDLEYESEVIVNYLTFNRFKNDSVFPEELKRCIYKMISVVYIKSKSFSLGQLEGTDSGAIASQSNDGVSISYNTISASEAFSLSEVEVAKIVKTYLQDVKNQAGKKVLYRGYYENE